MAYGQINDHEDIYRVCQLFPNSLLIDNISRTNLTAIARYLGVLKIGDDMMRISLKSRLRKIQKLDRELYFEGIDHLTKLELEQCCELRGMHSNGLSKSDYYEMMNEWIRLSVEESIPAGMLVISNMLSMVKKEDTLDGMLPSAVSMLNDEVIKEVGDDDEDEDSYHDY